MPTLLTLRVSKHVYLYTHEYTLHRVQSHSKHTKTGTNRLPVYHIHLTLFLSSSLPDTNPGQKIPFKSTVCRLCFTGRLCYCVITHKHSLPPSLFPSLSPATPPPPSLPPSLAPLQWEQSHWLNLWDKSCYPLNIKYQPFARSNTDKREGEWERERRGWQENLLQSTGRRLVCHRTAMTATAALKRWWLCNYEQGQRSFERPLVQGDRIWIKGPNYQSKREIN